MKYKLTNNTIKHKGITLYQIEAIKSFCYTSIGDLGGYVEKERNLSHSGNCWVFQDAKVYGNAQVYGDAEICGDAQVYGEAEVYGDAKVYDNAQIAGNVIVSGNAKVFGKAKCTKHPLFINLQRHLLTLTDNHISIGCKIHEINYWEENIDSIGKSNNYSEQEINSITLLITSLLEIRKG